ncbi:MAG TPA: glycoside hydrolase family 127 protein [Planctomycetota bacterium]|jgi:hypothetical protein|nr:glycoside hydrolase family 127 protein [Planctomycetota bacterium]
MLLALVLALQAQTLAEPALVPVPFQRVRVTDSFFAPRIATNRKVTIETCLAKCEETGRIRNFAVAGGLEEGKHEGLLFNDSDLYKVLEGIGYALASAPDPALEKRVDAIVAKIAAAQREDGYLDTYFQLVEPENRWKKEKDGHELYCAGHLIEAAIAYEQATGKRQLLDVAIRFADCIDKEYGWKKHQEATGHEELELALAKLFRRTGEKRYLELAKFFLDVRGKKDRGTALFGEHAQDHAPVREQSEVVGHAVRAMYLYCGMADVAAATGDATLLAPLTRIWDDLVGKKMYATGGIGSSASNEGFTKAYDLPNDTAYCETCAAIGMALWNHRMFLATRDTKYADVLEREVYNNVPAGVSLSGDRFFYDNPLASDGSHERVPWFDCSCCPTNVVRFLPAMGERVYATSGSDLYVILYAASTADVEISGKKVRITQETDYPRSGHIRIRVDPEEPVQFALHLRIPKWCESWGAVLPRDPPIPDPVEKSGDYVIDRPWRLGDFLVLDLQMPPRRVHADRAVDADRGRVALARGPIVYAFEAADNGGHARNLVLPPKAELEPGFEPTFLSAATAIRARGEALQAGYPIRRATAPCDLIAIPYCLWANRGKNEMVVWIPESASLAEYPGVGATLEHDGVHLSASHCWHSDTLLALVDGRVPQSTTDDSVPRMTFWDHRGTEEWIEMRFDQARSISSSRVRWFDDTGRGRCRVPQSAQLALLVEGRWRVAGNVGLERDVDNKTEFMRVEVSGVRLDLQLAKDFSAGVLEWQIE